MQPVVSRQQARELDARLISAGVPSLTLMENAGRGAADVVARDFPGARLLVVCGAGNNAGDGLVLARRWLVLGFPVRVWLTTRALSPDALQQLAAYEACEGAVTASESHSFTRELEVAEVLIDALFGTGLSRQVNEPELGLIAAMNDSRKPVVALDVPSGLDCDTGEALGICVRAHTTISFGAAKRASFTTFGHAACGRLEVVDIGAPLPWRALGERVVQRVNDVSVKAKLERRGAVTHKGQAGHVLVVAGAFGTTGAALLAARGAFRAGAGLVTIATHADVAKLYETQFPEVMKVGLTADSAGLEQLDRLLEVATSVVVGPGLGLSSQAFTWVEHVSKRFDKTVVVDADAITQYGKLSSWPRDGRFVFTPHPGEAARLLGTTARDVERDRFGALTRLVQHTGNVVVLKGAPAIVADPDVTYVNRQGASCMSTAGAGDVLAGVVAALACQMQAIDAAWVGAWVHAAAGELWAEAHAGQRGMLAQELADNVPAALGSLQVARRVGRV